jgi:hypothetical protein
MVRSLVVTPMVRRAGVRLPTLLLGAPALLSDEPGLALALQPLLPEPLQTLLPLRRERD